MRSRLAVLLVLSLLLSPGLLSSGVAAYAASTPWSGYRIDPAPTADGGFIGARKTDRRITYRLDADARRAAGGYRKPKRVAGDRRAARAAWILSKYGDVQIADQAAAVDVATFALMSGKRLGGPRATARMRDTGRAAAIRSLARIMLSRSKALAGPYSVGVTTVPGSVGGRVKVRVRVTSANGRPVPGLPVLITLPGQAVRKDTSERGGVSAAFPAEQIGLRRVKVVVQQVPEWRLSVRRPQNRGASRIALAGVKTRLVARAVVAVRAVPRVTVPSASAVAETGRPFSTSFSLTGSDGAPARAVTATVHGPFPQGSTPACTGAAVATSTGSVMGDGTYTTAPVRVGAPGLYAWRVTVAESPLNAPATGCGGVIRVRTLPGVTVETTGQRLAFRVSGMPPGYTAGAVAKLFGPYARRADATCRPGKKVGEVVKQVTGDGRYVTAKIAPTAPGVYAWRLQLPATYFTIGTTTGCGIKGSFVDVS